MTRTTSSLPIVYGENILTERSVDFGSYTVLTTPPAWELVRGLLHHPPAHVAMAESLERTFLDRVAAEALPVDSVVGIGGGTVVDAAKYVAGKRGGRLYLAPSITSGDGAFSPTIAVREGGKPVGMQGTAPPAAILVDYAVIRQGDPIYNRSGYGDLLRLPVSREDWRLACRAGKGRWSDEIYDALGELSERSFALAPHIGALSDPGIQELMGLLAESIALCMAHPDRHLATGAEHLFAWNLEQVTGKHFVHGQAVALGNVVSAVLQGNAPERMIHALREARLPYRPLEIGITWDEFERTLRTVQEYNRAVRRHYTILEERPITPEVLRDIRGVLEGD